MVGQIENRVLQTLSGQRILPLITRIDARTATMIVEAVHLAGWKTIEYAARSADSEEVFSAMVDHIKANHYDLLIGVGSVLNVDDAKKYHELGADYIICPHIDEEIAGFCKSNHIFWIPGAATLNEVMYANRLGAGMVKLFPADVAGGPAFVKAIRAPFPHLKLMPSGGVTTAAENLKEWFDSGAVCVGIGSNLFSAELLNTGTIESLRQRFLDLEEILSKLN